LQLRQRPAWSACARREAQGAVAGGVGVRVQPVKRKVCEAAEEPRAFHRAHPDRRDAHARCVQRGQGVYQPLRQLKGIKVAPLREERKPASSVVNRALASAHASKLRYP